MVFPEATVARKDAEAAGIEAMADQIFALTRLTWMSRHALKKARGADLSNTEFLALDFLEREGTMSVGQLQRRIGILPAQMSRVIKSLETRFSKPLVACAINPQDKRKIDLSLTEAGRRSLAGFKSARLAYCVEALRMLCRRDREEFMRILATLQASFEKQFHAAGAAKDKTR